MYGIGNVKALARVVMAPLMSPTGLSGIATASAFVALMCSTSSGCDGSDSNTTRRSTFRPPRTQQRPVAQGKAVSVRCTLAVDRAGGDFRAAVTVENLAKGPVHLLRYSLPEDGTMTKSLFVVERDGATVPYRGRAVKRAAPTAADYFELGSGEQAAAVLELASAYDFSSPGRYAIRYRAFNPQPGSRDLAEVVSNTVRVEVTP